MEDNIQTITGVPPLTVEKADGVALVDYKIYGNTEQDGTPTLENPVEIESVGDPETYSPNNLPDAYEEVEYLESTTTQYIDTGLVGKPGYTLETEMAHTRIGTGSYQYFAGYAYTGSADRTYYTRLNQDTGGFGYTYGPDNSGTTNLATITVGTFYKIKAVMKANAQEFYLNDNLIGTSSYGTLPYDESNPVTIYMFTSQYVGSTNGGCYAKCKWAKWYDENDNLVRHFIPCFRKSDNVAGMYDLVNNVFYTNAGTGSFTVGPSTIRYKIPVQVNNAITNIYLDQPLRKLGNYADYIDFANQKVVRRVFGETITSVVDSSSGTYRKFLSNLSYAPLTTGSNTSQRGTAIATIFQTSTYTYSQLGSHGGYIQTYITTSSANRVVYTFNDTSVTTIAQARVLIGDGFEMVYVLATPIEETIELPEILLNDGTNTIEVLTDVQPSNMEIQYYLLNNKLYNERYVAAIATAIRAKNGLADTYTIKEMAPAINAISGTTVTSLSVTENGTYTAPTSTAYSPVTVNVPVPTINPLSVTTNGTYTPTSGTAYGTVTVNVKLQMPAGMSFAGSGGDFSSFLNALDMSATSQRGNFYRMFEACFDLTSVPFFDTSSGDDFWDMFRACWELVSVPAFNLSQGTRLNGMFEDCIALSTVPVFNLPKARDLKNMFYGCESLSSTSLQNILKSLLTLTSDYTGTKTLAYIGLDSTQATTCTSFPEWATLTANGWTTGY